MLDGGAYRAKLRLMIIAGKYKGGVEKWKKKV
jgi:hypothetical protein